jgi:hypothetical protein
LDSYFGGCQTKPIGGVEQIPRDLQRAEHQEDDAAAYDQRAQLAYPARELPGGSGDFVRCRSILDRGVTPGCLRCPAGGGYEI